MKTAYRTSYDPQTDSLYIELRPLEAQRSREIAEDIVCDYGEDGQPVGYDVQHARNHAEWVIGILTDTCQKTFSAA